MKTFSYSVGFLCVMAILNAGILLGTLYQRFVPGSPIVYSYLDKDIPLEMPVGLLPTVEMTFQESTRFTLDAAGTQNWETLFTNQFGIGFAHLGPYHFRHISGAYHALHCLYSMQGDFDAPDHAKHPSHHFLHCLMYMRQLFLCNADATLEEGDFMARNLTMDRVGHTRQCRDWTVAAAWINQNFKEWAEYNGVSFDTK